MSDFKKFPSIEAFHNVYRYMRKNYPIEALPLVYYRGKIKVHGTNAAVRVDPNGVVTAQKRTSDVFIDSDNCGFASWVQEHEDYWRSLAVNDEIVFFGEWAGPGVMKGTAANKIADKVFFVFAILLDGSCMITAPDLIEQTMIDNAGALLNSIRVLPWETEAIEIDFCLQEGVQKSLDWINAKIADIDEIDPYILEEFGVSGPGEGLVFVPCSETGGFSSVPLDRYSTLAFKAKGQKHLQVKQRNPTQIAPEVAENIKEFVDKFVTEIRLNQGLVEALDGDADLKRTGDFLRWVGGDVKKETEAELEASGLEWRQVAKAVNSKARDWLITQSTTVV